MSIATSVPALAAEHHNSIEVEAKEERAAIQAESELIDIEATNTHCLMRLQQPDTSWGAHAVAKAWLRDHKPMASYFERIP